MPINAFGNSSNNSETKNYTSPFVQKTYSRFIHIESNFEEDIDMKKLIRNKNQKDLNNNHETCSKKYVDNNINDPSIINSNAQVDLNNKSFDNVRFIKVNSMPAVGEHLTAKYYVDQAIFNSVEEFSL